MSQRAYMSRYEERGKFTESTKNAWVARCVALGQGTVSLITDRPFYFFDFLLILHIKNSGE